MVKVTHNMCIIQWILFFAGLIIAVLLGFFVTLIIKKVKSSIPVSPPEGIDKKTWDNVINVQIKYASKWLGLLERILVYVCLWMEVPQLILAWLAFKLASKWQTWAAIVKVPENIDKTVKPIDFFRARHQWGTRVLQVWLVGTLANVLAGFLAYLLVIFLLRSA